MKTSRNQKNTKVKEIEKVQRAVEQAAARAIAYIKSARNPTSEGVHAIIDKILSAHGCESPEGHIVAGGKQSAEPHEAGSGRLRRGEPIVIDIYPRSKKSGYFADMTRTVCVGKPPAQLQKMYAAVLQAQELALSMIKPGVNGKDIQQAVEKYFASAGFKTSGKGKEFTYAEGFVHGVGHGVSKKLHANPKINRTGGILKIGDVVTVEPGLYYKRIGGVRIEDMVVVTKQGHRNLTRFSKKFSI